MKRKNYRSTLVALAGLLLVSSCAATSPHDLPQLQSVQDAGDVKSFADIAESRWPTNSWWQRYNDAQLNQLITEALQDSPDMQIAAARVKNAQGLAQQAGALQRITGGISADASQTKVSYEYQSYMPPSGWNDYGSLLLDFSYDFDFWGKNKAAVARAASQLAEADAEMASARLLISTSIAGAYAELSRLYANLDTVTAAVKVRNTTLDLLKQRRDNGLETDGAVSQAKSAAANAEAELLGIQENVRLQKNLLAALLGKGPDRALKIDRPVLHLTETFGLPHDIGLKLLQHRPDLTAARWQAQAAASNIDIARAQFYPSISVKAFIGYQAFGISNLFSSGNDAGSIGPAIYLPIFSGGRLQGQLTSAEASYELAAGSYNKAITEALHEIADVTTSSKALTARIEKTEEAVDAARSAHRIISNRYKGGLARYLDVLNAEEVLLNAERSLVNLQSRAFTLDLALVRALGAGYNSPTAFNEENTYATR